MNELKAPSLNSLLGSDRGSTDSLLAESLLDVEEVSALWSLLGLYDTLIFVTFS